MGSISRGEFRWIAKLFYILFIVTFCSYGSAQADFIAQTIDQQGSVTVMQVTGDYSADLSNGSPNPLPRQEIAKEFYKTHADDYDFLVIFSNFDFQMPALEAAAFYLGVKNDTHGIGQDLFDHSGSFGSAGRLQGTIDMGNVASLATDPLSPEFSLTLGLLSHELLHRWAARSSFQRLDGVISSDLLGMGGNHWSFLLDTAGSLQYGNRWVDNGDGTFTSLPGRKYFSPIDLYLMGLLEKSQVPPMLLIDNKEVDPAQLTKSGVTISGQASYVTIDDIIAADGERIPGYTDSQKDFNIGCILVTQPGTYTGSELQGINNLANAWPVWFSSLTGGVGKIALNAEALDTLPSNPGIVEPVVDPRSAPPEVQDGVAWLQNHQLADGSWQDASRTMGRDTAEAVAALANFTTATTHVADGIQWLTNHEPFHLDFIARKIEVMALTGNDASVWLSELVGRQNPDGGWGSQRNYLSNPSDTGLALRALSGANFSDEQTVGRAVSYLLGNQHADGGWGNNDQGSMVETTVNVLMAFEKYLDLYDVSAARQAAVDWLLTKQNEDGGFGNSPSTIYNTAAALMALKELGISGEAPDKALAYILERQTATGSWAESPYQTAMAIEAIWHSTQEPDLVIPNDAITLSPAIISQIPSTLTLTASLWNIGLTDVADVKVALYADVIADSAKLSEQVVSIAGQSTVPLSFAVEVDDGEAHRYYLVVDPDDAVEESSESNNTVLKTIYPDATYDFELTSAGLTVSPVTVDFLQDVTISATVKNSGTRSAYSVPVRYSAITPSGQIDIATVTVDVPAGSSATKEVTWRADQVGSDMDVVVSVDPDNSLLELDESNNSGTSKVTVNAATDPNLTVNHQDILITPSPASQGDNAIITALIKNQGFSTANNITVEFYVGVPGVDGVLLGRQVIPSLNAAESTTVGIDWQNIPAPGEKVITVVVDPANTIQEIAEDDNSSFVTLPILNLPDFAVHTGSISFLPAVPKDGDVVTINVVVQNLGEQGREDVSVHYYEGESVISTEVIPVFGGNSQQELSFTYDTLNKSGSHQFRLVVDEQNLVVEQREDNNQATRILGVQNADLWLSERYISPNGDGIQDSTEFFFRLESAQTVRVEVVNSKGFVNRTFAGGDLEETLGSTLTWDGLADKGTVVADGEYQIRVVDGGGSVLAALPVTVDNDRSPLTEAIGTDYLLQNNITCELPDIGYLNWSKTWLWNWTPDESGIVFLINNWDELLPDYPAGFYSMGPDGSDISPYFPTSWQDDSIYSYYYEFGLGMALSQDSQKLAFIRTIYKKSTSARDYEVQELWAVDRSGANLTLLDSYLTNESKIEFAGDEDYMPVGAWSPDGSKFAYFIRKNSGSRDEAEEGKLYIVNADGSGKIEIPIGVVTYYAGYPLKWSPDGKFLAYTAFDPDDDYLLELGIVDGADGSKLAVDNVARGYETYFLWTQDSSSVVYLTSAWAVGLDDADQALLSLNTAGEQKLLWQTEDWVRFDTVDDSIYGPPFTLFDDNTIVISAYDYDIGEQQIYLIDIHGVAENNRQYTQVESMVIDGGTGYDESNYYGDCEDYAVSSASGLVAYADCSDDTGSIKVCDSLGGCTKYENGQPPAGSVGWGSPYDLRWSADGRRLAYIAQLPVEENGHIANNFLDTVVILDVGSGDKKLFVLGVAENEPFAEAATRVYYENTLQWMGDNVSVMGSDENGTFVVDSENGVLNYLPIEAYDYYPEEVRLSPLGNYITVNSYKDTVTPCASSTNIWSISSLLNLKAVLAVTKDSSALYLKGTAADRNFESFTLEYADLDNPTLWQLIAPPTYSPRVNEDFTSWVPPYEGNFLIRLTVRDKAGNEASSRKRVSWGMSASLTNLYQTENIFSPNGDGVKDSVNLHYSVTEPIHLEFFIYDEDGLLVNSYSKDHSAAGVDYVTWDGRNSIGQVVEDGDYVIKVFDYSFGFTVDTSPPQARIGFSGLYFADSLLKARLEGHVDDENLLEWIVEYGEGINPQEWHEYLIGTASVLGDGLFKALSGGSLGFAVNKQFRITAKDEAGNVGIALTSDLLEEALLITRFDESFFSSGKDEQGEWQTLDRVSLDKNIPGKHSFTVNETYISSLSSVNVQYRIGQEWINAPDYSAGLSAFAVIPWDNSTLAYNEIEAMRVRATTESGQEVFSNVLLWAADLEPSEEIFYAGLCYDESSLEKYKGAALLNLPEDSVQVKFQYSDSSEDVWTDFLGVGVVTVPNSIVFYPYQYLGDDNYLIRMVGESFENEYFSDSIAYPPTTKCESDVSPPSGGGGDSSSSSKPALFLSVVLAEAEGCNNVAPGLATISASPLYVDAILFRSLSYYLENDSGSRLLKTFDLTSEPWGEAVVDTNLLAEGAYTVKAVFEYEQDSNSETLTAQSIFFVDRTLPIARLTGFCPALFDDPISGTKWSGLKIDGIAEDNKGVKRYSLFYGYGENPTSWEPALNHDGYQITGGSRDGLLGVWDYSKLKWDTYTILIKTVDRAGNISCDTKLFTINETGRLNASLDTFLFSPNTDGKNDFLNISYDFTEPATITTEVWNNDGLVRQISSSESLGAPETIVWDGKDAAGPDGQPVEDGVYTIRIQATDSCGAAEQLSFQVTVDNTPPEVSISSPQVADNLAMLVPVAGVTTDLHFEQYILEAISDTATNQISIGFSPVSEQQLGSWNINGLEGQWSLRLVATDRAGNSSEALVPFNLGARNDLLKALLAEPEIFSPNDDGKRDSAEIRYELAQPSNAKLEIFDESSTLIESADLGAVEQGSYSFVWQGNDGTTAYPDGNYQVALTVSLASDPTISQREVVKVTLDNTLPVIDISSPQDQVFLQDPQTIEGSLGDDNIATYSLVLEDENGVVWEEQGAQSRLDYVFTLIGDLVDGTYSLTTTVTDQAENLSSNTIAFVVDKTAPGLLIQSPQNGELFGGVNDLVQIIGNLEEVNLDHFVLRYGAGNEPSLWTELVAGDVLPNNDELASLTVGKDAGISDGIYTLSLLAIDKAGWESEVRVGFEVDNTPPEVTFLAPMAGGYVTQPLAIIGSVLDQNLREYSVSVSPGDCIDAYKWQTLATSYSVVNNGDLASWKILPSDGKYCLDIEAEDANDFVAKQNIDVQVDTLPPAPPVLTGLIEKRLNAALSWSQSGEADLAGYNLYKDGKRINENLLNALEYSEVNLPEGEYVYTVKAVDHAGQESVSSNEIALLVDVTGPSVNIASPQNDDVVSDLITIKGGAYSSGDFKEYRIYVGVGSNPSEWQQIRRSPVPIPYGDLASWDTLGLAVGQYAIKLEAEDLLGNVSSAVVEVSIDNEPPSPPVLLSATPTNADVDLVWQTNSETDVAGYLLYRNHQLVNGPTGTVVDDMSLYLIDGTAIIDSGVPDGTFVYYLEAMDNAGNISGQSNSLEVSIDMRPPHAEIVTPQTGHVFEYPLTVKAESIDSDVATVQFQYKRASDSVWQDLQKVSTVPFVISFDPSVKGEPYGDFNLRSIATDQAGKVDPFPEEIVVTYTDLTPPQPPVGLASLTQGGQVNVEWQANSETDFAGYNLYQLIGESRVKLNTALLETTTFLHQGDQGLDLEDGTYVYGLTAVDGHGNESKLSSPVEALIYAPLLQQSYTPTLEAQSVLIGTAQPQAQVELWLENDQQNIILGTPQANVDGSFTHQVDLLPGENSFFAKATDVIGNASKPSEQMVVVLSALPSMPTGLDVIVDGYNATATWNANSEADILGYQLVRNDQEVEPTSLVSSGVTHASDSDWTSSRAFDGSSSSYWGSNNYSDVFGPVWWQLDMPEQKMVNEVAIEWRQSGDTIYCASDFEIQVWSGYGWVTKEKISGNSAPQNTFDWDQAYRTDKIRIYITDLTPLDNGSKYVSIFEVRVSEEHVISSTSYSDTGLTDGEYQYQVAAINEHGFKGPLTPISEVTVGDVVAPEPPINLLATVTGSDVQLTWAANSEVDLAGYNVYLQKETDWVKLNTDLVQEAAYLHGGLRNGSYSYRVTAVDGVGNESQPSQVATADIEIALPFSSPLLAITAPAEGSSLFLTWGEVSLAAGYNLYRSTSVGGPYTKTHTAPLNAQSYNDSGLTNGISYYYVATAVDSLGNESAYSNEVMATPNKTLIPVKPTLLSPTTTGVPLTVQPKTVRRTSWAEPFSSVELYSGNLSLGRTYATGSESTEDYNLSDYVSQATMSPDGHNMAYLSWSSFYIYNTVTEEAQYLGRNAESPSWAPDGKRLAYVMYDSSWDMRLHIYEVENDTSSLLISDQDVQERYPSWSADGAKIAFVSSRNNSQGIWLKDLITGELTELVSDVYPNYIALAPDARHLVFSQGGTLYLVDLVTKTKTTIDEALNSRADYGNTPCWAPDSTLLAFASSRQGDVYIYVVDIATGEINKLTDIASESSPFAWSPDGARLLYVERQSGMIWSVDVAEPGARELVASEDPFSVRSVHWPKSGEIYYVTNYTLSKIRPAGLFTFEDVPLAIGDNILTAISTDSSENVSPSSDPTTVTLDAGAFTDLVVEPADILVNPIAPLSGDMTSIAVAVRNESGVVAENVDVSLSMWEPGGQVVELTTVTVDTIQPYNEALIQVAWDSTAKAGEFTILATADVSGKILEVSEVNNFASSSFHVALEEGIGFTMQTDKDSYAENEQVAIDLRLHNSGIAQGVTLKVDIEDGNSVQISSFDDINAALTYGGAEAYSLTWNTATTYAGTYQVRGQVFDAAGSLLREEVAPFTLEPNDCLEAALSLAQSSFGPREDVRMTGDLINCGSNYNQPELSVHFTINDGENPLHDQSYDLPWLLADGEARLNDQWNTALQSPGDYTAQLEVSRDNVIQAAASQSFTIEPVVLLAGSVKADPSVSFLGRPVGVDYLVANNGNTTASGLEFTIIVQDAQTGAVVAEASHTLGLDVSATYNSRLDINGSVFRLGSYNVLLQAERAGEVTTLATDTLLIKDGTPPVVEPLSPLAAEVYNGPLSFAVNATDNATGIKSVEYSLDGIKWLPLPAAAPGSSRYTRTWSPTEDDEGNRRIRFRATDGAGNVSEPVAVDFVVELKTPFEKLEGSLSVSPSVAYQGQELRLPVTINNVSKKDLANITARVILQDKADDTTVASLDKEVLLSALTTYPDSFTYSSLELEAKGYRAVLQVISPEEGTRDLATATFTIKSSLAVNKQISRPTNLLVWLNTRCRHHRHRHQQHQQHDYGFGDDDDDHHVQRNKDEKQHRCTKACFVAPDCDTDCLRLDLLEDILEDATDHYALVFDRDEFRLELRNPLFTDIVILGDQHPLTDHFDEELRDKVYSGSGLIVSGRQSHTFFAGHDHDDILGVDEKGTIAGQHEVTITTTTSPISEADSFAVRGQVAKVEAESEATIAAWASYEIACPPSKWPWPGKDDDKAKTEQTPAIVLHRYGLGETIYYGFELMANLDDASFPQLSGLITRSLAHIHDSSEDLTGFYPYQLVKVQRQVESLSDLFTIEVREESSAELLLFDPESNQWLTDNPWTITMDLEAKATVDLPFYVLLPDQAGLFTTSTEVGFWIDEKYVPFASLLTEFDLSHDRDQLIDQLLAEVAGLLVSRKERGHVRAIETYLAKVEGRPLLTAEDINRNIHDIEKAVNALLRIDSADIHPLRLGLARLLRIEQGRFYYFVPPLDYLTGTLTGPQLPLQSRDTGRFTYTLTNDQDVHFDELTVRVRLVEAASCWPLREEEERELPAVSSVEGEFLVKTRRAKPGTYQAILEVGLDGGDYRELARTTFEII